ncbi:DUF1722 domain-containing protein [Methanolobus halotolerans]|uniref:DUF1722 domain-containing protein n=1 Tax=Methanolobus halotolerans TaxID=2052935 RepID=A0A4E0Q315_9EURY|nr:DUF1722 domain-containing protein [Methanolobus halotolerans]TGC07445.1 hypothetical protein CUN85_11135 [Methanolobus halotolerans]
MSSCEKELFEDLLRNYMECRIDEDALKEVLRLYVLHYDSENINDYTLLYPYPDILRMHCDEKRDEDYWS